MNRKRWAGAVLGGVLTLATGTVMAQESAPEPRMGPGPRMGFRPDDIELMGFGGPHGGKVVTGAPFTATAVSETTQTLGDGNRITTKTQANLYRDSQGRVRKEVSFTGIGAQAAGGQSRSFVVIQDPVAKMGFFLAPDEKVAHRFGAKETEEGMGHKNWLGAHSPQSGVKTESLGTQKINGLTAEGTRMTQIIPAGEIGNQSPLTIVYEKWYSSELQMTVMSKRSDPRFGETTYTLTNIQRTEPDASLFSVPQDYTITEGGPHTRGLHGAPPPGN